MRASFAVTSFVLVGCMGTALALLPGGGFRGWNMKWRVSRFHQTPLSSTDGSPTSPSPSPSLDSIEDAEIVEPAKMTNDTTSEFAAKVKAAFEAFEDVKSSEAAVAALKGAQGVLGQLGNNASRASTAGAGILAAVAGGAAFGAAGTGASYQQQTYFAFSPSSPALL